MPRVATCCLVLSLALLGGGTEAQEPTAETVITGDAVVENADILRIGETRIILWGIDAPEPRQTCPTSGRDWGCYEAARRTLAMMVDLHEVSCIIEEGPDRFGNIYGTCHSGDIELNAELVRTGMALAYVDQSDRYLPAQEEAKSAKVGLWQDGVEFREPWIWRSAMRPGGYR